MLSIGTIQLIISLISEAPGFISAIQDDITAISGGTLTEAEAAAKWTQMNADWQAAKNKWTAA